MLPAIILAGGLGTRLREETDVRPKPMVEVGGHPMLWHVMKIYAAHGVKEFAICLGYKGEVIKDFFLNYRSRQGSISVELGTGEVRMHDEAAGESWIVHLLDTGLETMTGGRIRQAVSFLGNRSCMVTYGDGVSNVNISALLACHQASGRKATITAVRPPARFGGLLLQGDQVSSFTEKPQVGEGWINGGFMVLQPEVADLISGDDSIFERAPLESLAEAGELTAYRHDGFWQCVDTVRDLTLLRELWETGSPPWKIW